MKSFPMKSVLGALAAVSLLFLAGSANATESTFCATQFNDLRAAIHAGDFTSQRDRDNLLGKTESAVLKSNILKVTDALANLAEIESKATTLATAAKPKLGQSSADAIVGAAGAAAACVADISIE